MLRKMRTPPLEICPASASMNRVLVSLRRVGRRNRAQWNKADVAACEAALASALAARSYLPELWSDRASDRNRRAWVWW